jgi:hypothetical protein
VAGVEAAEVFAVGFDLLREHQPFGEEPAVLEDLVAEPVLAGERSPA